MAERKSDAEVQNKNLGMSKSQAEVELLHCDGKMIHRCVHRAGGVDVVI